ncbi:hypothetical protein IJH24_01240 [Candidatus Saccharibacteria bacterium]|nr:hypothetical protein [Candidatus Saccharibacteria bacterium]
MNPSYDNSFGSFSSGGTSGGAIQQQQPIVINNGKAKKPVKKILITILLIVLVVGGVALAVLLFLNGRQSAKDEAEELYYTLASTYNDSYGQCQLVTQDVDNINRTKDGYKETLDECQTKSDRIEVLMKKFENKVNSEEYRQLYSNLKSVVSERILTGETLKNRLMAYEVWHNFRLELSKADLYQLPEDMEEMIKPLREIEVKELNQYAEQWLEKREALSDAFIFVTAFSDNEKYVSDYEIKLENYESLANKTFSEVVESMRLDRESSNSNIDEASYLFNIYVEGAL